MVYLSSPWHNDLPCAQSPVDDGPIKLLTLRKFVPAGLITMMASVAMVYDAIEVFVTGLKISKKD